MIQAWDGLPLSTCRFEASGRAGAHAVVVDTILVWSGGKSTVDIQSGGRGYSVQRLSGMVDFLPAGVVIDDVRWRGEPSSCLAVVLPPAQVEAMGLERPRLEPERHLRIGSTDSHVVDLVRRLHARASEPEAAGGLYLKGLSLTLASYVYEHFVSDTRSALPGAGLSAAQCQRLTARIDESLAETIAMSELAAEVGYSQDHFLRLFTSSFGVSPHRYVMGRRIERAKSMLEDPGCSLVDVAFACGFSSQAHFSTVFKLHVGVSPSRYRHHGLAEPRGSEGDERSAIAEKAWLEAGPRSTRRARGDVPTVSTIGGACPAALGSLVSARTARG